MKFSKAQSFLFQNLVKDRKSPCFEVRSNQIEILKEPLDYYLALHVIKFPSYIFARNSSKKAKKG